MPEYIPAEGGFVIAHLPGERVRALIKNVVTKDAVIVELTSIPLAKTHNYKRGDYVALRRKQDETGDIWKAVEEHRISIEELAKSESVAIKTKKKIKKKKKVKK